MEGKARFIFPVIISALIVFVVSGVVTFTNIGLRADFVRRCAQGICNRLARRSRACFYRDSLRAPRDRGHRAND
jgi:hypothetical protein